MSIADIIDSANKSEADLTRQDLGVRLVELLGRSPTDADGFTNDPRNESKTAVNEYGVGVNAVDRLNSVHPLSIGDGLEVMTAAFGDIGSRGAPVVIGRIAQGQYDSLDFFWERKTFPGTALPVGETVDNLVQTTVRIPTNRTVALVGVAFAMVAAATASTQVDMSLRLGGATTVNWDPTLGNRDGAIGPPVSGGLDTNIQTLIVPHVRVLMVAGNNEYSEQNVNIRFDSHGGSGNSRVRSAWLWGARVVF